jgi:hypothetical protein
LHEFRNHLTVLMAAANELRAEIPPVLALQIGEALGEAERNVEGLTSLVALVDASVRNVEPLVCDLGDVLERAVRLAKPAVGRRVMLSVTRSNERMGIKNRGSTLECLVAALIADLARAGADGRPPRVSVQAIASRGSLAIEIESDGAPTTIAFEIGRRFLAPRSGPGARRQAGRDDSASARRGRLRRAVQMTTRF